MQPESDAVLKSSVFGKSTVAAFVGQNPKSHGDCSGNARIRGPEGKVHPASGVESTDHLCAKHGAQGGSQNGHAQIFQGSFGFGLEAIRGDDGSEILRLGKVGILPLEGFAIESTHGNTRHVEGIFDDLDLLFDFWGGGSIGCRRVDRQGIPTGAAGSGGSGSDERTGPDRLEG